MKVPNYIKNHVNFNEKDYCYLTSKGWSNREIKERWDKEVTGFKNGYSFEAAFGASVRSPKSVR